MIELQLIKMLKLTNEQAGHIIAALKYISATTIMSYQDVLYLQYCK